MSAGPEKQRQPRWWRLALMGGLVGGLFGVVSGPIVMVAAFRLESYLHDAQFMGFEILGAPLVGAGFGAFEGIGLGAIWRFLFDPPRRLTIARLMLVVGIAGPSLAIVLSSEMNALLFLGSALPPLPLLIAVFHAVSPRTTETGFGSDG